MMVFQFIHICSRVEQHVGLKIEVCPVHDLGASINSGPQNRPKYMMVLIIGATRMGSLIFGNSHFMESIDHA